MQTERTSRTPEMPPIPVAAAAAGQPDAIAQFAHALKLAQQASAASADIRKLVVAEPEFAPPDRYTPSLVARRFIIAHEFRPIFNNGTTFVGGCLALVAGFMAFATGERMFAVAAEISAAVAVLPALGTGAAALMKETGKWREGRYHKQRQAYDGTYATQVAEFRAKQVGTVTPDQLARMHAVVTTAETSTDREVIQCFVYPLVVKLNGVRGLMTASAEEVTREWKMAYARTSLDPASALAVMVVTQEYAELANTLNKVSDTSARGQLAKSLEKLIFGSTHPSTKDDFNLLRALRIHQAAIN